MFLTVLLKNLIYVKKTNLKNLYKTLYTVFGTYQMLIKVVFSIYSHITVFLHILVFAQL